MFGRVPVERTHGEIIVGTFTDGKLLAEIIEGIECMRGVEFLIVFSMAALDLAVMSGSVRTDQLVTDAELTKGSLKERLTLAAVRSQAVGKLHTVICLNALDGIREALYAMTDKLGRGIGTVLPESL